MSGKRNNLQGQVVKLETEKLHLENEIERQKEIIRQLDNKNLELTIIIKEVRKYANTNKNCIPKHIKDYINNLIDKENI